MSGRSSAAPPSTLSPTTHHAVAGSSGWIQKKAEDAAEQFIMRSNSSGRVSIGTNKKDSAKKSKRASAVTNTPQASKGSGKGKTADESSDRNTTCDAAQGKKGTAGTHCPIDDDSDSDFTDSQPIVTRLYNKRRRRIVSSPASSQSEQDADCVKRPRKVTKAARANNPKRRAVSGSDKVEMRRKYGSVPTVNSVQRRLSARLQHKKETPLLPPQPLQRSPDSSLRKIKRVRRQRPEEEHTHSSRQDDSARRYRPSSTRRKSRHRKCARANKSRSPAQKRTIRIYSSDDDEYNGDHTFVERQISRKGKRARSGRDRDRQLEFPTDYQATAIAAFSDDGDSPALQRRRLSATRLNTLARQAQGRRRTDTPPARPSPQARPSRRQKRLKLHKKTTGNNRPTALGARKNGGTTSRRVRPLYNVDNYSADSQEDNRSSEKRKVQSTVTQMWQDE